MSVEVAHSLLNPTAKLSLPLNSHLFRLALSVIQIDNAHKISCFKKSYERTTINEPEMRPIIKNIYPIIILLLTSMAG